MSTTNERNSISSLYTTSQFRRAHSVLYQSKSESTSTPGCALSYTDYKRRGIHACKDCILLCTDATESLWSRYFFTLLLLVRVGKLNSKKHGRIEPTPRAPFFIHKIASLDQRGHESLADLVERI